MGRRHRNPTSKGCWRDHPYLHGHHLVQNVLRLHWTDPTARTAPRWCPGPMRAEGKDGLMTLWASVELETSARNGSWTVEPSSERKLTMDGVQNTLSKAAHLHLCATCVVLSCNQPGMTLWVRPRLHQLSEVHCTGAFSTRGSALTTGSPWQKMSWLAGWVVWLVSWLVLLKGSEIMLSIYTSCCTVCQKTPIHLHLNCQKKTHKASKQDCRSNVEGLGRTRSSLLAWKGYDSSLPDGIMESSKSWLSTYMYQTMQQVLHFSVIRHILQQHAELRLGRPEVHSKWHSGHAAPWLSLNCLFMNFMLHWKYRLRLSAWSLVQVTASFHNHGKVTCEKSCRT